MAQTITYPFIPKSTLSMLPGQFWQILLSNGKFACGRVLQLARNERYGNRTVLLAGLLDWSNDNLPTSENIAGCKLLEQGSAHIKTISWNGGVILGHRLLELDGITPFPELSHAPVKGCMLMNGLDEVREATLAERKTLQIRHGWGLEVIKILAELYFVEGRTPVKRSPWDENLEFEALVKSQSSSN